MVDDIRDPEPELHWGTYEDMRTGLMSYRCLDKTTDEDRDDRVITTGSAVFGVVGR